jgi:hypothetical protein
MINFALLSITLVLNAKDILCYFFAIFLPLNKFKGGFQYFINLYSEVRFYEADL